jgi:glutathione synthase/RimK-type ligase-like ATP-grasp enzyme
MMNYTIAIQNDDYGPGDSSSPIWTQLLQQAGHTVKQVNVYDASIIDNLRDCQGFMWRHMHIPEMRQIAHRLLPVAEREMNLVVYPDQNSCWHYDDKIAQALIFEATGIPAPKSWIFFDRYLATEWARSADYPTVLKLSTGAGSTNVRLIRSEEEALRWIDVIFGRGVYDLSDKSVRPLPFSLRLRGTAKMLLKGVNLKPSGSWELHKNYVLFQEFLPGNDYDTRVTVIGNRAFGFRRYNRNNDFRASGSGKLDYETTGVAPEFIRLGFDIARRLNLQSCAIDGMWRGSEAVTGEISYTYVSRAVHGCPGHWDSDLNWHQGPMMPEEAQIEDFLARLESLHGQ